MLYKKKKKITSEYSLVFLLSKIIKEGTRLLKKEKRKIQ